MLSLWHRYPLAAPVSRGRVVIVSLTQVVNHGLSGRLTEEVMELRYVCGHCGSAQVRVLVVGCLSGASVLLKRPGAIPYLKPCEIGISFASGRAVTEIFDLAAKWTEREL